jgi:hypothetical protein
LGTAKAVERRLAECTFVKDTSPDDDSTDDTSFNVSSADENGNDDVDSSVGRSVSRRTTGHSSLACLDEIIAEFFSETDAFHDLDLVSTL